MRGLLSGKAICARAGKDNRGLRSIWRRGHIVDSIASAPTTTKKWRVSGARATKPYPATRPALSKWLMGLPMARKFQSWKACLLPSRPTTRLKRCLRLPPNCTRNRDNRTCRSPYGSYVSCEPSPQRRRTVISAISRGKGASVLAFAWARADSRRSSSALPLSRASCSSVSSGAPPVLWEFLSAVPGTKD